MTPRDDNTGREPVAPDASPLELESAPPALQPGTGSGTTSEPGTGSGTTSEPGTGSGTTSEPGTGSRTTSEPATGSGAASELAGGSGAASEPAGGSGTTSSIGFGRDMPSATVDAATRCCRALSCATRLHMLRLVCERPGRLVSDLAEAEGATLATASRHVEILVAAGLVRRRRSGRRVLCHPTAAGEWACEQVVALGEHVVAQTPEPPPTPVYRDPCVMTWMDPERAMLEVDIARVHLRWTHECGEAWRFNMRNIFGPEILPRLPLLATAATRLAAGERLHDLPLPPEVVIRLHAELDGLPDPCFPDDDEPSAINEASGAGNDPHAGDGVA